MIDLSLQPWSENDLPLLQKLLGDPEMMAHLGGPESPDHILQRHQRYIDLPKDGTDHMFKIVYGPNSEGVGNIGYWKKSWRDRIVYETGWLILPEYQGRGIATKAAQALLDHVRVNPKFRFVHTFPSISNTASNAICRKLHFELIEECNIEYPPGHPMVVNDWRLELLSV